MLFTIGCIAIYLNNSHKLGLALFALGIIVFFGHGTVLGYINMIASIIIPPTDGFYQIMLQSYNVIYTLSIALIIAGVVMFYRGRKESGRLTSSASAAK